jgi:hypothetical protein
MAPEDCGGGGVGGEDVKFACYERDPEESADGRWFECSWRGRPKGSCH